MAAIIERWRAGCANWRGSRGHRSCAGNWLISPGATTCAAIILIAGQGSGGQPRDRRALAASAFGCSNSPRYLTWTTSSGRTQCTRSRTSGEPKRLVRSGGASSGISGAASGCRRCHSRFSSALLMQHDRHIPSAVRGVVGQQKRAKKGVRTRDQSSLRRRILPGSDTWFWATSRDCPARRQCASRRSLRPTIRTPFA